MRHKFLFTSMLLLALMGCNGNKTNSTDNQIVELESPAQSQGSLEGRWRLNDFAGETEMTVLDSETEYVLQFFPEQHIFGMQTDCNSIGGEYKTEGDSIKFDNIAMTQMACPNETVERAMARILPMIDTYAMPSDSVLKLRADARTMATFNRIKD